MLERSPLPIEGAAVQRWTELALQVRMCAEVITRYALPLDGSDFSAAELLFPSESLSQWSREGIRSAVDHMSTWADFAVPLQQFDGQLVVYRGFRWPFTLMRAAIEGASQSLWLMQSGPVSAALARFVRMIRHDLSEQRRAWKVLGRDSAKLDRRMERHEAAANVLAEHGPATAKLPAMVDLVRIAAAEAGRDADVFEAHWRVCSAAAHGKDWAVLELQSQVGERFEWRPGQFHFEGVPNVDKMTKILEDTMTLVSVAVIRFLQRSGVENIDRVLREAALTAARATPQQDGGAHVENLARVFDMA